MRITLETSPVEEIQILADAAGIYPTDEQRRILGDTAIRAIIEVSDRMFLNDIMLLIDGPTRDHNT